jgi:hypothetical protein
MREVGKIAWGHPMFQTFECLVSFFPNCLFQGMGSQLLNESTPNCVRNLCRTDLYQKSKKSISPACPFKREGRKNMATCTVHRRDNKSSSAYFVIYVFQLSHTWYLNAFKIYFPVWGVTYTIMWCCLQRGVYAPHIHGVKTVYNGESTLPAIFITQSQYSLIIMVWSVKWLSVAFAAKSQNLLEKFNIMEKYVIENLSTL